MGKGLRIEYLESELEDFKMHLSDLVEWCESSFKYLDESPNANLPIVKLTGSKSKFPSFNEAFKMAVKNKREFLEESENG
jgi:hypothetical protein